MLDAEDMLVAIGSFFWTMLEWLLSLLESINNFDGFIADLISAFIPIFLAVWLSLRFALRKFATEKWWEKKAAAYEAIIEATYHGFRYYDEAMHEASSGGEIDEETHETLKRNAKAADSEIVRIMTIGTLKVSQEFLDRLQQLRRDEHEATQTTSWSEHIALSYDAYRNCLTDLVLIAKKILN